MVKYKHFIIIVGGFFVPIAFIFLFFNSTHSTPLKKYTAYIGDNKIIIEIAESVLEKQRGLSDRASLDANAGMLFVYDKPDFYHFWMKDMLISLDFIWIDDNKEVVDITQHVPLPVSPKEALPLYTSKVPAQYILEVNAGWAERNNVQVGDVVSFENF